MAQSMTAVDGQRIRACPTPGRNRFTVFEHCPHCDGAMAPEHAHYRCRSCGWRDSCCD